MYNEVFMIVIVVVVNGEAVVIIRLVVPFKHTSHIYIYLHAHTVQSIIEMIRSDAPIKQ